MAQWEFRDGQYTTRISQRAIIVYPGNSSSAWYGRIPSINKVTTGATPEEAMQTILDALIVKLTHDAKEAMELRGYAYNYGRE